MGLASVVGGLFLVVNGLAGGGAAAGVGGIALMISGAAVQFARLR